MAIRTQAGVRLRVRDDEHLEHLLDEAEGALNRGDTPLGITHLSQAVLVAQTKGSRLSEFELTRRVKGLIASHGGLA